MWWWTLLALAAAVVAVRFGVLVRRASAHVEGLLGEVEGR